MRPIPIDREQMMALCQRLVDEGILDKPTNGTSVHPPWWKEYHFELDSVDPLDSTLLSLQFPNDLSSLKLDPVYRKGLVIDEVTMRDLRLIELVEAVDSTQTKAGRRMLEYIIHFPLSDLEEITKRQAAVRELSEHPNTALSLLRYFQIMKENERGFVEFTFPQEGDAPPRQETFQAARNYLGCVPSIVGLLGQAKSNRLGEIRSNLEHLLRKDSVRRMYENIIDGNDADIMRLHPDTWNESVSGRVVESLKEIGPIIRALKDAHIKVDLSRGQFRLTPRRDCEDINISYPLGMSLDLEKVRKHYFDKNALFNVHYTAGLVEALCSLAVLEQRFQPANIGFLNIQEGERFDCDVKQPANLYYLAKQGRFVPNDYLINEDTRGFVITGPNTGGKTVYAFTLPGLQSLTQSGSSTPHKKGSATTLVDHIYTLRPASKEDVGEGRYLHSLVRGREIMERATPRSLVVIDDFEGTDPEDCYRESLVIVEKLRKIGAAVLITTQDRRVALEIESNTGGKYNGIMPVQLECEVTPEGVSNHYRVIPGVGKSIGGACAKAAGMDSKSLDTLLRERGI